MEVLMRPPNAPSSRLFAHQSPSPATGDPVAKHSRDESQKRHVFDMITSELMKIGAIPLSRFTTEDNPQEQPYDDEETKMKIDNLDERNVPNGKQEQQAVAKIYEACMRTFESSDAISFDFTHEGDIHSKALQCILTITRPDGHKRSYTSGAFSSITKDEAKALVASSALNMGVIDFIKYGDITLKGKIINNPKLTQDAADTQLRLRAEDGKGISFSDQRETTIDDPNVKAISDCCIEWRAGKVKPVYVHFSEPTVLTKPTGKKRQTLGPTDEELLALKQGCALRISITQHTSRVYSVHHIYRTRAEAKAAVAAMAIAQGVLDFIKFANGQTSPTVVIRELEGDGANEELNREIIAETSKVEKDIEIEASAVNVTLKKHQIPLDVMTLSAFANALPKPFPETPGLKPVGDENPVGWLNAAVQSARGSKMTITWTYLSNAKLSMHGCLVRLNLPRREHSRSYLVEPQFTKRGDAKAAVALLAISQNIGGWIHEATTSVENLLTPEMRTKAATLIAPLYHECTKAGIPKQPIYEYAYEDGAVGCTLRVKFSPTLSKAYTVPIQYRTKPDARFAVILQARHEGVLEFIRFKGQDPPPGYNPDVPFDYKMAKKVEEAQKRGEDQLMAKEIPAADEMAVQPETIPGGHIPGRGRGNRRRTKAMMRPRPEGGPQKAWMRDQTVHERHDPSQARISQSSSSESPAQSHAFGVRPPPESMEEGEVEMADAFYDYGQPWYDGAHEGLSSSFPYPAFAPPPSVHVDMSQHYPAHSLPRGPFGTSGPFPYHAGHNTNTTARMAFDFDWSQPNVAYHPPFPAGSSLPTLVNPEFFYAQGSHRAEADCPDSAAYIKAGMSRPRVDPKQPTRGRTSNLQGLKTDKQGVEETASHYPPHGRQHAIPKRANEVPSRSVGADHSAIHDGEALATVGRSSSNRSGPSQLTSRTKRVEDNSTGSAFDKATATSNSEPSKKGVRSPPSGSSVEPGRYEVELQAYRAAMGGGPPLFRLEEKSGRYSVTLVLDKEKFSLPTLFGSANEAREIISRKVLSRLRDTTTVKPRSIGEVSY
ncbi:hypothetical protein PIIN_01923 [Serendipita indica DSM 11827]|uniref:Uncharacterized protein n=1 Tax=Serendipita indica (strain DSM 11827) TaxID=1109443 RepID=G4T9R3_SERID|nr:hypothetical protein PIIN_01923 [Serendipita indica DSM 11827]